MKAGHRDINESHLGNLSYSLKLSVGDGPVMCIVPLSRISLPVEDAVWSVAFPVILWR